MFQLLGAFLKYTFFAIAVLVASHLITVENRTLSMHVASGLSRLAILPTEMPSMNRLSNTASETANQTVKTLRRAWSDLPEVGVQNPSMNRVESEKPRANPHRENHSVESQRDLQAMLRDLRTQKVSKRPSSATSPTHELNANR